MSTTPSYLLCLIAFLSLMSAAQAEESPTDDSETRPWDWSHTVYAATDRIVIFGDGLVTYEDYSPPDDGYLDVVKERSLPRIDSAEIARAKLSRERSSLNDDFQHPRWGLYITLKGRTFDEALEKGVNHLDHVPFVTSIQYSNGRTVTGLKHKRRRGGTRSIALPLVQQYNEESFTLSTIAFAADDNARVYRIWFILDVPDKETALDALERMQVPPFDWDRKVVP